MRHNIICNTSSVFLDTTISFSQTLKENLFVRVKIIKRARKICDKDIESGDILKQERGQL